MENEEIKKLIKKYNAGHCTDEEKALLENWYFQYNEDDADLSPQRISEIGKQVYAELPVPKKADKRVSLLKGVVTIITFTALTIASWHLFDKFMLPTEQMVAQDVSPGGNRATLTLTNGKTIDLKGDKNGLAISGKQLKYLDGSVVDGAEQSDKDFAPQKLSVPNGGQYHVVLSDGTKVWLNAASSLTHPASFANAENRIVELTGEAYFEVKPFERTGKKIPFIVKTAKQTVEVLGTQFNINSYEDEGSIVTTLIEGSVRVSGSALKPVILKPDQQSVVSSTGIQIKNTDMETDLAWRNGMMEFRNADIKTIMKEISRWYDIKVEYRGKIADRQFSGSVSRSSNLSVLLKILAYSDIHFMIENDNNKQKKLIVTP
ncbi:FecR family protein [Pedobacter sp. UBA4863]|uniref:FecR family protein n=1 Tax=Pedobacter sp. UBA4863 TaxID=1947060 RepID=UPI0025EB7117|nr:FecR domain-containing protein [Pedobacter sp. UBA4863]